MGARGPQAVNVVTMPEPQKPPEPERGMVGVAKKAWVRIVEDLPADYFRPSDFPLLRAYCEAYATHVQASRELRKEGRVITSIRGNKKRNPWFDIQKESASTMAQLATKLRICPNSRFSGWKAETKGRQKPKSRREGLMFDK